MRPCHFFPHCECVLGIGHPADSVVNTKLPAILSHRHRTTVSLETYPFIRFFVSLRRGIDSVKTKQFTASTVTEVSFWKCQKHFRPLMI